VKKNYKRLFVMLLVVTMVFSSMAVYATNPDDVVKEEVKAVKLEKHMDSDGNKMFDTLETKIDEASDSDEIPVIVVYNEYIDDSKKVKVKELTGNKTAKYEYDIIPGMALSLTKKEIKELAKLDFVKQVEYDEPVYATLNTATYWYGAQKIRTDYGVDGNRDGNATSYSTTDVVVAVIDTGIDASHVDLDGGKVLGWYDLVNGRATAYDDNGHGTHCASIVAGTGEGNSLYKGVAPGAALVGVKVLDSAGSGSMSNVTAGINWAVTNKNTYGIKVISLSLGTSGSSDGTDSTSLAVNSAYSAGLVVCVAAGNAGPAKYTIGSPGAATNAFTVGAMCDPGHNGYSLAYFSSRGPTADNRTKPNIAAPGYYITAAKANSTNAYVEMSGTSMATPFTAGTAALILDANYSATPSQVYNYMTSTAQNWGPTGQDIDYGYGNLSTYNAVKAAGGYTGTTVAQPTHLYAAETMGTTRVYDYWTINVTNTTYPIAITMIMPNWTGSSTPDFDMYLVNPSGTQVASALTSTRQETINFKPTVTGTYTIKVYSYAGTGNYFLDVSSAATSMTLTQDN